MGRPSPMSRCFVVCIACQNDRAGTARPLHPTRTDFQFRRSPALPLGLFDHVIDHMAVLVLWAEHDNGGILHDAHIVSGRPVKEVVLSHRLLPPLRIRRGDLALEHIAPVRALAAVVVEAFEQRRRVDTLGEREMFGADLIVTGDAAEAQALPYHCSRKLKTQVNVIFCNFHRVPPY
ncbi:hypothetical protein MPL3356_110233 [Mesorhizobium plurifarium]|uniref:Uncharacterized protein n=1 Tax=Mesorhizobium plurifarium TaxID=69974 RepID=A0A090DFN4_MESPL|nr:hypothetical protein MPL3356_110233 [Mesorhizobium plurifarium]